MRLVEMKNDEHRRVCADSRTAAAVAYVAQPMRGAGGQARVLVPRGFAERGASAGDRGFRHPSSLSQGPKPARCCIERDGRLAALEKIPFFAGLGDETLPLLARQIVQQQLEAGEILFVQGQPCKGLYVLESGHVRLSTISREGREQVLMTCGPGATLSELPVIDGGSHPYCATAVNRSSVFFISSDKLHSFCKHDVNCAVKITGIIAARLRSALGMIEELSFDTVRKRLAAYLLRAATSEGADGKDPVVQLPTSQEIASQIGTVRELVSRNMSQLRRRRVIWLNGRTMHVLNMNALTKEAAGLTSDSSR